MTRRSHRFIETYGGMVGFGLDRKTDENTLIYYLQAFSDDTLMRTIIPRMSDAEMDALFTRISELLKKHLNEPEYHRMFLKEKDPPE